MYARKSGYFSRVLLPIISRLQMGKKCKFQPRHSIAIQTQFVCNFHEKGIACGGAARHRQYYVVTNWILWQGLKRAVITNWPLLAYTYLAKSGGGRILSEGKPDSRIHSQNRTGNNNSINISAGYYWEKQPIVDLLNLYRSSPLCTYSSYVVYILQNIQVP